MALLGVAALLASGWVGVTIATAIEWLYAGAVLDDFAMQALIVLLVVGIAFACGWAAVEEGRDL